MININTVLVLGAGASAHLDYPLGLKLIDNISVQVESLHVRTSAISAINATEREIFQFIKALRRSGSYSIDSFLEHRPEYMEIGKYFIAQSLIPHEDADKFYSVSPNWYRYLFDKMNTRFEDFHLNKLKIVTFNYDRSLEAYFFEALKYKYKKSDAQASEQLQKIPVIHLHGKLGPLPWEDSVNGRPYKVTQDPRAIKTCSEGIKIIHESDDGDREFSLAANYFEWANRIIFLGFGYHPVNMGRLKVPYMDGKEYYGSAIGMTDLEIHGVGRSNHLKLSNKQENIEQYLRNNIILDR